MEGSGCFGRSSPRADGREGYPLRRVTWMRENPCLQTLKLLLRQREILRENCIIQ